MLREKQTTYSWEKPQFDAPLERRRLRILNAVFLALGSQGCGGSVRGEKAREIHAQIGQSSIALALEPIQFRGRRGDDEEATRSKERLRLGLLEGHDRYQPKLGRVLAEDTPVRPIERAIREIVVELIVLGEEKYRERRLSHHQWRIEDRVRRIAEAKRQREEAERKERERIAALKKARVDRLLGEAGALQLADKIREYVTSFVARVMRAPGLVQPEAFARWKTWALAQADRIDPVASGQFIASMRSDDVAVVDAVKD